MDKQYKHTKRIHRFGQFNDGYFPVMDGVLTCARNYAYWLNKKYGYCGLYVPTSKDTEFKEDFQVLGYRSFELKKRAPYRVGMPGFDRSYRSELDLIDFDLVHTHSPFSAAGEAFRIRRKLNVPVVGTFHSKFYDDIYEYTKSKTIASAGISYIVRQFNHMDSVWSVSEGTAETLREYGYKGPITIIPNGQDLKCAADVQKMRKQVETMAKMSEQDCMFLFVGQHIKQKNIFLTLKAIKALSKRHTGFKFVTVGTGNAYQEAVEWVKDNGLEAHVTFLGAIYDRELLSGVYERANVFVFPSVYDNAPIVLREAAAMSTPPIVIEGSNSAQGIEHMQNGMLCSEDQESLMRMLEFSIQNRDKIKEMGQNAKVTLSKSWEEVVDMAYYEYLLIMDRYKYSKRFRRYAVR